MKVRVGSACGWRIQEYAEPIPQAIRAMIAGGMAFVVLEGEAVPSIQVREAAAVDPCQGAINGSIRRKALVRLQEALRQADRAIRMKRRGDTFCRLIG